MLTIWVIWITFCWNVKCSPVGEMERLRHRRDIYPEIQQEEKAILIENEAVCVVGDVVYAQGDSVPAAEQSCLQCRCQPPEVACEAVNCEKKAGCRPIHKPNTCCPDYKCDCEYNGRFYANGERLETEPGGECRVCYCSGGELQCAKVSCYIRPDCEGRKVEGKCCPKYDHCPLREPYIERGHFVTTGRYEDSTAIPTLNGTDALFDDNAAADQNEIVQPSCEDEVPPAIVVVPKITIQEIIPEVKEIAITSPPKREISSSSSSTRGTASTGQLLVEETFAVPNDLEDSDVESSEIAEIYQQPPVLRIGDKLLFLKQGELVHEKDVSTPKTVITIIGAEGLQRGFEESFEVKDGSTNASTPDTPRQAKDASRALETLEVLSEAESGFMFGNPKFDEVPEANITVNQNMTVDEESTSRRIITMLKEIINDNTSTETTELFELSTEIVPTESINLTMLVDIELPSIDYDINGTNYNGTEDWVEIHFNNTSVLNGTKEIDNREDNPEYPPIPDIMTSQNDNLDDNLNVTTESPPVGSIKILPDVLPIRSNKTVDSTNSTKNEWLKSSETVYNKDGIIPDVILKASAASDEDNVNATVLPDDGTSSADFFDNQLRQLAAVDDSTAESSDVEVTNSTYGSTEEVTDKSLVLETMSSEDASVSIMDDVEVMNSTTNITHEEFTTVMVVPEDVEVFSTTAKTIEKRHDTDENDKIFDELSHEIKLEDGTAVVNKSKHEEQKEAEVIFKELLEETGTTARAVPLSNGRPQPRDRESAVLQRVSDAIAKFQLRDTKQSLDTSILGILRDFFSSQYRSYNSK